jgi:ADP-heptose:LPS heptosyltransferase
MILVHAGLGWDTKTFPKIWWEEVVNALVGKGCNVGLIGKRVNDEHGYVDIDLPEGVVDFRDKLSMKGLIALIANAPVLVTNDSLPLHIAGAFDNSIVLIPTCKRADCLLPYRKGSIYHKAVSVCKKTIDDDNMFSPTAEIGWKIGGWQIGKFKGEHTIEEYLPDPQEVVQAAINFSGCCND